MIVRYNRGAVHDTEAIAKYIRDRNPKAAVDVRTRIKSLIDGLADFTLQGTPTDHRDIRRLVTTPYPYLIFYRIKNETVIILHIRHGRRRPETLGLD